MLAPVQSAQGIWLVLSRSKTTRSVRKWQDERDKMRSFGIRDEKITKNDFITKK